MRKFPIQVGVASVALAALACCVLLIFLSLPRVGSKPASDRALCRNQLHVLYHSISGYEADHGHLPPPYLLQVDGKVRVSWRVLLLKYLQEDYAYEHYDFHQAWDGPRNRALRESSASNFQCPLCERSNPEATDHLAVVGPGTAWPVDRKVKFSDIAEVASNLILLVELRNSDIHWMEPRDLAIEAFTPEALQRRARNGKSREFGTAVLFADGEVWQLHDECPDQEIAKLFTIEGATAHSREEVLGRYRR